MSDRAIFLERSIDAPPAAVWRVLTDVDAFPKVLSHVVRVERVAGTGYAVGTRWLETRTVLGQELTAEHEVAANQEHHSTIVAAKFDGIAHRTQCWLQPAGEGTLLQMRSSTSFSALPWSRRVLVKAIARATTRADRKLMQQELNDIARAAEAPDAGGALARI